jgi:hypothetical protein
MYIGLTCPNTLLAAAVEQGSAKPARFYTSLLVFFFSFFLSSSRPQYNTQTFSAIDVFLAVERANINSFRCCFYTAVSLKVAGKNKLLALPAVR